MFMSATLRLLTPANAAGFEMRPDRHSQLMDDHGYRRIYKGLTLIREHDPGLTRGAVK